MQKIRKDDMVIVIAGKDKDKTGKVLSVKEGKVIVEGVNMATKHSKPRAQGQTGGIIKQESPIYASKVMLICPKCGKAARTGKPIILSTGIAELADIELALQTCAEEGNQNVILLKCVSEYPTPYEELNLKTIPHMKETFDCMVGLSDHSMGTAVDIAGVALGACVVEKHLTLKREDGGPDGMFSMEPQEFEEMVTQIRNIEKAIGKVTYTLTEKQKKSRGRSRSLYVVEDIQEGEIFTDQNVKSIRPGYGLHTKYYEDILGKVAACNLKKGTAMKWDYLKGDF